MPSPQRVLWSLVVAIAMIVASVQYFRHKDRVDGPAPIEYPANGTERDLGATGPVSEHALLPEVVQKPGPATPESVRAATNAAADAARAAAALANSSP